MVSCDGRAGIASLRSCRPARRYKGCRRGEENHMVKPPTTRSCGRYQPPITLTSRTRSREDTMLSGSARIFEGMGTYTARPEGVKSAG